MAVLALTFFARWLLADWNSYWLDELLSVNVYGLWHDSALDAVRRLADSSIHPPLYQFTLYHWMSWFGDSELATRSLSNVYITLATLFVYLLVREFFARRLALASAVAFAMMNIPTYYGLETRSYGQTIFLVALSSYLLRQLMRGIGAGSGQFRSLISPAGAFFTLANTALLLTHYYNVFFWVAQGIFVGVYILRRHPLREWVPGVGLVAAVYGLQAALFGAVWGRVFIADFRRRAGDFALEGDPQGPIELLLRSVVTPNIDPPRLIAWVGLSLAAFLVVRSLVVVLRGHEFGLEQERAWTVLYLTSWLILPLVVVSFTFAMVGVARYSLRYFVFSVPALAPLIMLTVEEAYRLVSKGVERIRGAALRPGWSTVAALLVITTLIVPGGHDAATSVKHDWRGIVRQVVDVVQADEDSEFIIFETSHRREPMTNFYFERFSTNIRAYETLQRYEERAGEYRILTVDEPMIAEHDYLILLFTHSRTAHFPDALEQLEERYEVRHRQLNHRGRGFIVFAVRGKP